MRILRLTVALLLAAAAAKGETTRNLFREVLGKTDAEITARIERTWTHFTQGDPASERLYYEVGDGTAYIADVGSSDVRSEGVSYGMMIAVQLDRKDQFDRLWRWACLHMRHIAGPRRGYFAWQCKYDGEVIGDGVSASDGEVWMATALLLAANRWGDGEGIFNYTTQARDLLGLMLHKEPQKECVAIFDREHRQVVFCPIGKAATMTDPSYHMPPFYELWARKATSPEDRAFWLSAAEESRLFFRRNAHPQTGLMSEYAHFDGRPYERKTFGEGKDEFGFDAWRTLAFVALDHAWTGRDAWQVERTDRALRFLAAQGDALVNRYTLDGKPLGNTSSPGLIAMAAASGIAASDPEVARPFVEKLWAMPDPRGKWRYYDGMLVMLGLIQASGRFSAHEAPAATPPTP
jgi:oligosaccharide reducing-end xylanase